MTGPHTILALPPVPADLMASLQQAGEVIVGSSDGDIAPVPAETLARVTGVITGTRVRFDAARFDQMTRLRVVSNFAVGTDNVDLAEATRRGVLVCNTPGVLDRAVADLTMGLVLASGRQIVAGDRFVRSGRWATARFAPTVDVSGKTLGILGLGRIGREVAKRARGGFDMTVLYHQPRRTLEGEAATGARYVERDDLLRASDWISLHLPDSPVTRNSVGAREFALMKPSAFLVNLARGSIVDEPALIVALTENRLGGAALDVMASEPLGADHPLAQFENVTLSPHVGSATVETRRAMMEMAVANLLAVLSGRPPRALVNAAADHREAGERSPAP